MPNLQDTYRIPNSKMTSSKADTMRGLAVFISDVRNCKSREAEMKRINKELANIRSKFKGDKTLDGYQKKKYVCKLVFIFLLGHDIDFGHMEAVNLLSSNKYTEKQIGYLFISVLVNADSELLRLIIMNIKSDLSSRNAVHNCLALQCICSIGSQEMAQEFKEQVPKMLIYSDEDCVKQSAALALLSLIRAAPNVISMPSWASSVIDLINNPNIGVVTAAVTLIESTIKSNKEVFMECVGPAVSRLSKIVTSSYTSLQEYTYYNVAAPWLCIKLLRLLQFYPPPEDPSVKIRLTESLEVILKRSPQLQKGRKTHHSNAIYAVLFEAINLIIHMDSDPKMLGDACSQMGQFLKHRETNLRYLALETMCLLAASEFSHNIVKSHKQTVINTLKSEKDISVRQRAVDLLYAMCDRSNAEQIVNEMLTYLETADFYIREELVLKVAILAEKYAIDYTWYVDTILNLIRIAGDYVGDEVWYRVIQIVTNREDVQGYAAKVVFEALTAPSCHENMVKVGGYILGEFGNLIAGDSRSVPMVQFQVLHSKFHLCSVATRGLLLSTYVKFINLFPEIKESIKEVLSTVYQLRNEDVELQQRAMEYHHLSTIATHDMLAIVLEEMPPFQERESSILAKLRMKKTSESLDSTPTKSAVQGTASAKIQPRRLAMPQSSPLTPGDKRPNELIAPAPSESTGTGDLLGNLLVQLGDPPGESSSDTSAAFPNSPEYTELTRFICKNDGVLYKNNVLQVECKCEFRGRFGKMGMYVQNKAAHSLSLTGIKVTSTDAGLIAGCPAYNQLVIEAGQQAQILVNLECVSKFISPPILQFHVALMHGGPMSLKLPVFFNKFMVPAIMDQDTFFKRWTMMKSSPEREVQHVKQCGSGWMTDTVRQTLSGFGFAVLDSVDTNTNNFVGAGILSQASEQIGCLLRIEVNPEAKMYRITMAANQGETTRALADLLVTALDGLGDQ